MSNIEFDDILEKIPIRSYTDVLKEKQSVEYETPTTQEQVIII